MKNQTTSPVFVRVLDFSRFSEHHITADISGNPAHGLARLISLLEERRLEPVRVFLLGEPSLISSGMLASLRRYPVVVVGNSQSVGRKRNLSVHITAVSGGARVKYLHSRNRVCGAEIMCGEISLLYLSGLTSAGSDCGSSARKVYRRIEQILKTRGYSGGSVYRCWNYIADIDAHYGHFNTARNACFDRHGITVFPAATGIEASLPGDAHISLSLEALKQGKKDPVFRTVSSNLQCEAHDYGPRFSRAVTVGFPGERIKKFYLSGTSSVARDGKTILEDDISENVRYVMACAEHLLDKSGLDFSSLLSSYVYCVNERVYREFLRCYRANHYSFPFNPVFTNICRNNFLFEIEGIASSCAERASLICGGL